MLRELDLDVKPPQEPPRNHMLYRYRYERDEISRDEKEPIKKQINNLTLGHEMNLIIGGKT